MFNLDKQFWINRWKNNEGLGFNQLKPNIYLQKYLSQLNLLPGARIFVPLCGKSIDMYWLHQQGFSIIGLDLSEIACGDFFIENKIACTLKNINGFNVFESPGIKLLEGDFFKLKPNDLEPIHAVYDRAALIALPPHMRIAYATHMAFLIKPGTQILLICFTCEEKNDGPPFSVSEQEIHQLFSENFEIEKLHDAPTDFLPNATNQIYRLNR